MEFSEPLNAYLVLAVLSVMIIMLIRDKYLPSLVFIAAVSLLVILGVISTKEVVNNLANKQILIIFLMIMLSSIIKENFNIVNWFHKSTSRLKTPKAFLVVMNSVVAGLSSVFNNTPIVVMLVPLVYRKAKELGVSPAKFLMPLSFSAILGGMITLVGTSTNLVLNGFLETYNEPLLSFVDFMGLGILVSILGIVYMFFYGYDRLGHLTLPLQQTENQYREYFVETQLTERSNYVGKTLFDTQLRKYAGVTLIEVIRGERIYNVVAHVPNFVFEKGDRLIFTGRGDEILDFLKHNNELTLAKNVKFNLNDQMHLLEVSVPYNFVLEGKRIKDTNFRKAYNAAIIAIHRNGEKLSGKIGEMIFKRGDLLMLVTGQAGAMVALKKDFYIISDSSEVNIKAHKNLKYFIGFSMLMLVLLLSGTLDLFSGLLGIILGALFLGITSLHKLRQEIDLDLLIILVGSLVLGEAFLSSGAAELISSNLLLVLAPYGNSAILVGLMILTILLTSFITNVAAVSVAFPLAYSISQQFGIEGEPFYLGVAFAASAAFMTPIGYQTNLLVTSAAGYRFKDFLRVGSPLTLIYIITCIVYLVSKYQLI
ncbi:SLC13 family permease [Sediminitomix flava]|uniref:TrkA family protein n=1 Tax=Sediminitomix flava TaxID=379075 RepID=A0A315Z8Q5_SEDFL|nr:SLC13 family permease [Sediminitomix flava]PWJ39406.1 TrkA family protein [Sediminitomix flava]